MANIARARVFLKRENWAEKLRWSWLRNRRSSGYKFRRQHPKGIYYLDFFCEAASLAIELNGFGHSHPDRQIHDTEREKYLTSQRIKVLRFWNSHLRRNAQSIRDTVLKDCGSVRRIRCWITRDLLRERLVKHPPSTRPSPPGEGKQFGVPLA